MMTYYDDACLRCDSPVITMNKQEDGVVIYKCTDCGWVWSSEDGD